MSNIQQYLKEFKENEYDNTLKQKNVELGLWFLIIKIDTPRQLHLSILTL